MNDFIGRYQCNESICDDLIEFFKQNKNSHAEGLTNNQVHKDIKDSTDLCVSADDNKEPIQNYTKHLWDSLFAYAETYSHLNNLALFGITEPLVIQHYKIGGGYKTWHCERGGGFGKTIKRVLVFMTYLNDVPDGGTMFKYQNLTETATKGKTLIWSSDWTHTHKGQISNTKEKTIITGWFSHMWDRE